MLCAQPSSNSLQPVLPALGVADVTAVLCNFLNVKGTRRNGLVACPALPTRFPTGRCTSTIYWAEHYRFNMALGEINAILDSHWSCDYMPPHKSAPAPEKFTTTYQVSSHTLSHNFLDSGGS